MSSTVHFALLRDPKLVDVVDEEWEKEVIPEDGALNHIYLKFSTMNQSRTFTSQLYFFLHQMQTPFYLTEWML